MNNHTNNESFLPRHSWYSYPPEAISDPIITTKKDRPDQEADIELYHECGQSDSCMVLVTILLWDTGHTTEDGRPLYDADFRTNNEDNAPLYAAAQAVTAVCRKFFESDLCKQYALIGGDGTDADSPKV